MEIKGTAKLLRLFVGESEKIGHTPLYEIIVREARKRHLAGATVWRGVLGFGPTARMRTTKLLDLSSDLPMVDASCPQPAPPAAQPAGQILKPRRFPRQ